MTAHYKLHCPHCDFCLETKTTLAIRSDRLLKICPMCGELYADPYGTEEVLTPYKPPSFFSMLLRSLFIGLGLAFIIAMNVFFITGNDQFVAHVFGGCALFFWAAHFVLTLFSRHRDKRKHQAAWQESDKRLHDLAYALALKRAGYYVPARYLPAGESGSEHPVKPLRIARSPAPKNPPPHMPSGSEHD